MMIWTSSIDLSIRCFSDMSTDPKRRRCTIRTTFSPPTSGTYHDPRPTTYDSCRCRCRSADRQPSTSAAPPGKKQKQSAGGGLYGPLYMICDECP
ncbi:hypothetical protein MPTK1_5g19010 [Marchantia polymorpha subsp. ruderalis]|uniref:Uncharacterized protein n=2 Tax=Marchantia polymorpha TaxID=3197 RepID=A0AAF6BJX5_MARPO|nr:hypothetical protein MARPO_0073s0042 [Marchantia polymorpha]BBN12309.1 hypothetical protein Mp_5g19010 [Marchantia polymorpha subsp. ruderalis]|eukprot:PTQ35168.1 hypothetical protein MARPO_0073s0042 [Marchantia polymorpha]